MKRLVCFLCVCCILLTWLPVRAQRELALYSNFAFVLNMDNQEVVYEKASEERMYPASMTKIMTVLTALEHIEDFNKKIVISDAMLIGLKEESASVVGFQSGDEVRIIDLLYGIMLVSGADACRAIAFHIAGSEEAFVLMMNAKAQQLNLSNTHFVNTSGLHHDEHYTTVREMADILQEALKNEVFYTLFTSDTYYIEESNYRPNGLYLQSTKLVQAAKAKLDIDVIEGSKTGFTLEGGFCLASIASIHDTHYLMISGQAGKQADHPLHLQDALTMYDYLKQTYATKTFYKQGETIASVALQYGEMDEVIVSSNQDIKAWGEQHASFEETLTLDTLQAPIAKGDVIGEINIYEGDKLVASYPLMSTQDVAFSFIVFLQTHIVVIGIVLFLALLGIVYMLRIHRNKDLKIALR